MSTFTHLHVHTEASILDGSIRIKELFPYLKEYGMDACGISDHGWMAGTLDFYLEGKKAGIHPILGVEAYITEDQDFQEEKKKDNYHLVILAKDNEGFKILSQLVSEGALNNFYYKPRITRRKLGSLAGHACILSGCLASQFSRVLTFKEGIMQDDTREAEKLADFYLSTFGEDFYLELQDWPEPAQQLYNQYLLDLGRRRGIPFVITADCHCLKKEDHELHEIMMAMQLKVTLQEYRSGDVMRYGPHFYVKTPAEMLRSAQELDCEEAYHNTSLVAKKCHVDIETGKYKMPSFEIAKEEDYQEFLSWKANLLDQGDPK